MGDRRTGRTIVRTHPTIVRFNGRRTVRIELLLDEMAARMVAAGPSGSNELGRIMDAVQDAAAEALEDVPDRREDRP